MMMAAENSVEDYWEDASVSWGCCGLSISSLSHTQQALRDAPVSSKQDSHVSSPLRPRSFPPPIALCTTLSIKAGGRFVLKEMASLPLHSVRAEREQGRLCLRLVEEKDLSEEQEDGYSSKYDDNVGNAEGDSVDAQLHDQGDGNKALATEKMASYGQVPEQDSIQGMHREGVEVENVPETHMRTSEKIDTRDKSIGMLGIDLWSKESSNDMTGNWTPCSAKQVLSFARTSPPLRLAVS